MLTIEYQLERSTSSSPIVFPSSVVRIPTAYLFDLFPSFKMVGKVISLSFLSLLLSPSVIATPLSVYSSYTPTSHAVHEERADSSGKWTKRDRVHPDSVLPMRIGLTFSNLDKAHDALMEISNPRSENFGKHWTPEEVIDALQPSKETTQAVRDWLTSNGISDSRITHSDNRGWFAFDATNEEAERLLYTQFYEFEHGDSGNIQPACDRYHIPAKLQKHIDYITPGVKLSAPESLRDGMKKKRSMMNRSSVVSRWAKKASRLESRGIYQGDGPRPFTPGMPLVKNASHLATCDSAVTPACVAALYDIPKAGNDPSPNNSLGIYEALNQFYVQSDLDAFYENLTATNVTNMIPAGTHPIINSVDGGNASSTNVSQAGGEAELDFELAFPIVYPQTVTVYAADDSFSYNTFLDAIDGSYCTYSAYGITGDGIDDPVIPGPGYPNPLQCGTYAPTNVVSVSYGGSEAFESIAYQKRQCNEFMKLGLQGVSVMFASGDSGVANGGCLGSEGNIFGPGWPVTCPYVTAVGATQINSGASVFDPESAANAAPGNVNSPYSSAGGFSNVYPIPEWQQDAISTYFSEHPPSYPYYSSIANSSGTITDPSQSLNVTTDLNTNGTGIYNRAGRGIPDVSANGQNIAVFIGGVAGTEGGTSASSPIFSSIINRIVEERIKAGKGPLGFLNPSLYANPSMFNDITDGTNPGCGTLGFSAAEGWDPVTGLGTPSYPKMLEYFMSLP
ncbi:MAG: hypothetical protein M1822_001065 [Bathelium mastoideum]|nr:MAG: hypothetical protein M1822_001065 [Bathelium mastoideum]